MHLKAAVEAGKHVFMEKPVAVDVPGVRTVIGRRPSWPSKRAWPSAPGTQRRHQKSYREAIQRIRDGAIGEIVYARCYWDGSKSGSSSASRGWSDMEWQLRNWPYFTWLSGDSHRRAARPQPGRDELGVGRRIRVRAVSGLGGPAGPQRTRNTATSSTISPSSSSIPAACGCSANAARSTAATAIIGEAVVGTRGESNCKEHIRPKTGKAGVIRAADPNPYSQEHVDLIASIRAASR